MSESESRFSLLELDDLGPAIPTPAPRHTRPIVTPSVTPISESTLVAVEAGEQETGSIVYWSLSGEVLFGDLGREWIAAGINPEWLPRKTSAKVALREAARALVTKGKFLREHPVSGWALVDESVVGNSLDYKVECHVYLDENDKLQIEGAIDDVLGGIALTTFGMSLENVEHISTWLVELMSRMGATALRPTGGFYFVPKANAATLRAVMTAIGNASKHKLFRVPAMRSADMIEAVLDALFHEVENEVKAAEEHVRDASKGKRAAVSLNGELEKLKDKVRSYEKLLGRPLGGVVDTVSAVQKKLMEKASRFELLEVE